MDVLSAISGIITLLGAGSTIVQSLERLSSLREAPHIVLALNNEVSDFRIAIFELLSILQQDSTRSSTSQAYNDNLDSILHRAREKLVELESLIEYRLLAPTSGSEIRISRTAWLLERHKIKRLQEEIRSIRINLITMLGILNSNSISRMQIQLSNMCLIGTRVQDQLTQGFSRTDVNFHLIGAQLAQITTQNITESLLHSRNALHGSMVQDQEPTAHSQQSTTSQRQVIDTIGASMHPNSHNSYSTPPLLISSRIHQSRLACVSGCPCRCHNIRGWNSPQWLQSFLGLLMTGYVGIPLASPSCNDTCCQYRSEPTATIQYYFPSWFADRVLQIYIQLSKYNGITQCLRVYRTIWNGSELFRKINAGDLEGVKALLASRQASPFDTTHGGVTSLAVSTIAQSSWRLKKLTDLEVAVQFGHAEICRVLLQAGADPYQTDCAGRLAYQYDSQAHCILLLSIKVSR